MPTIFLKEKIASVGENWETQALMTAGGDVKSHAVEQSAA
jgi:hypothetical protein